MSPEAQRIAIAEACGYFHAKRGVDVWYEPEGGHVVFGDLPDYLNDLNAMHEAVEWLRGNQFHFVEYPQQLFQVVTGKKWDGNMGYFMFNFANATAAQRAEAFIRTLNLWNDSK